MRVTVVLLALLTIGGCASPAPTASPSAPLPPTPSPNPPTAIASLPPLASPTIVPTPTPTPVAVITDTPLPPGGISRDQAIAIAEQHVNFPTVEQAVVGRVGDLDLTGNPPNGIKPDRLVWRVSLIGSLEVCAPVAGPCSTHSPIMISVFLDYYTGEFLFTG